MTWSPEQRRAASERMRAIQARKKAEKEQQEVQSPQEDPKQSTSHNIEEQPDPTAAQPDLSQAPNIENEDYKSLKRQVEELKASLERLANTAAPSSPQVSLNRGLVGTIEKY